MVHLTAEEVYVEARKSLPNISLGTVYRNLKFLRDQGLAREIRSSDAGSTRFEATRDPHAHFHCRRCHAVRDLPIPEAVTGIRWQDAGPIASVSSFELHVMGECPDCAET
jgi:Fur family peroxide stress response transcriptional regulator